MSGGMSGIVATTISGIIVVSAVYIILQGKRAQNLATVATGATGDFGRINKVFQGGN